ncbi:MAG: sigma-70 family RNA polymerase sigma factor [Actinomycetota bacterium]|nr:sigma-70 family RNA polymerase sigma factor [Actinomycetota bacterium]
MEEGREALVRLLRDEGSRVLATLVRTTGSLELAEDAVQDAVIKALDVWSRAGVPPQPRAWLTVTARNRAIDLQRREGRRADKEMAADFLALTGDGPVPAPEVVADDLLRLVFTCCHPSLPLEAQTALALRTLCGLTTAEIARALLVPEATMAKRLTRARHKIAVARIPYRTPSSAEIPQRLGGVLATVYLLFNEGYNASAGDDLIRSRLISEALRLSRLLHELLPDEASVTGLLALVLLQSSRQAARLDEHGEIVLLADQDRTKWDLEAIADGMTLLGVALRRTPTRPDLYATQAAIAACHALAPTWTLTNWDAVISWYDVLLTINDTPVVRVNRAVAVAELHGPEAGLVALEEVGVLPDYPSLPAVRAELLSRLGRLDEAAAAYREALDLPNNDAQRRHLHQRLARSEHRGDG